MAVTSATGTAPVVRVETPFTMTIFGATGDLTHRKLMPALYAMFRQQLLPDQFAVIGFARRDYNDESFRAWMADSVREFARDGIEEDRIDEFFSHVFYHRRDIEAEPDAFEEYKERLSHTETFPENHLFYLSVKPELFPVIIERLSRAGLVRAPQGTPWTRVVIEKPFGRDLKSARELNRLCLQYLGEQQIYRIDHYLGKETVQNMLSFRFANTIFEPLFNNHYVDHVQITAAETVGMESARGAYYDETGALRDMLQSHLLQLLCLVAMEPPSQLTADAIRNEKVKVLLSVPPTAPGCVESVAVRAQYTAGKIGKESAVGYRDEDRIAPDSTTPTYVAMKLNVANWRWAGVPFYLRTGKRMARRLTEIVVQFKVPPLQLFQTVQCVGDVCDLTRATPNRIVIRIQPDEGITIRFSAKRPVMPVQVEDVEMDFSYSKTWQRNLPEAYERLLMDVFRGDSTLFTRSDEVEAAWGIVNPVLHAWENMKGAPIYTYEAGGWGPREAEAIFDNYDTDWHDG